MRLHAQLVLPLFPLCIAVPSSPSPSALKANWRPLQLPTPPLPPLPLLRTPLPSSPTAQARWQPRETFMQLSMRTITQWPCTCRSRQLAPNGTFRLHTGSAWEMFMLHASVIWRSSLTYFPPTGSSCTDTCSVRGCDFCLFYPPGPPVCSISYLLPVRTSHHSTQ